MHTRYDLESADNLSVDDYPAVPPRDGYRFVDWGITTDGNSGNITFTAQWAKLFSVTWLDGYTDTPVRVLTDVTGYTPEDAPENPAREGYTFLRWSTLATDGDGNVTITALWVENATEPTEPTDPIDPTEPSDPTTPDEPTKPEEPTTPEALSLIHI